MSTIGASDIADLGFSQSQYRIQLLSVTKYYGKHKKHKTNVSDKNGSVEKWIVTLMLY